MRHWKGKYNIGDVVRVRDDLNIHRDYKDENGYKMCVSSAMVEDFGGMEVTIKDIVQAPFCDTMCYLIEEDLSNANDEHGWYFVCEMFDGPAVDAGSPPQSDSLMAILDF